MTIGEATAVNVVLRRMIDTRQRATGDRAVPEGVVEAAALLADKAYKALSAGLDGKRVREALR